MIRPTLQGHSVEEALVLTDDVSLSAAIVDHALTDGDSSPLYQCLQERGIPFVVYSGFAKPHGISAPHVANPASHEALVLALGGCWGTVRLQTETLPKLKDATDAAQQFKPMLDNLLEERPMTKLVGIAVVGFVVGALWKK